MTEDRTPCGSEPMDILDRIAKAGQFSFDLDEIANEAGEEIARLRQKLDAVEEVAAEAELNRDGIRFAHAENKALRAELDEAVKDAGRYRWLRSQQWYDSEMCVVTMPKINLRLGSGCPSMELLDAAIDKAREVSGE